MNMVQRTKGVLEAAEKALAALASDAAKGTDYEAASCLIDLAREVSNLAARGLQRLGQSHDENAPRALAFDGNGLDPFVAAKPTSKQKASKSTYPKFLRHGETLVKIAWSPSEKAEYEHKSPKRVLPILAAAISKAGVNGRRFAMDRVMPMIDPADGSRIPDYQVYLCLAWFRELGFVIQHGRQGYSLASKAPIEPLLETHWTNLPAR